MPAQERGAKPARPLPYQPNANLTGFTASGSTVTADLALSNSGPHVRKASHFSVYDNTLVSSPSMADFPRGFPGQYTVPASRHRGDATPAIGPVEADGGYDITVVGPNRFLRRFTGNVAAPGAGARVTADYCADPAKYQVDGGQRAAYRLDPLTTAGGWYDLTVTIDGDDCWAQRYAGHLETGRPSVAG
jgi:phospholipase C